MSKSIAELRASRRTSLPERNYQICMAQGLVAEVEALTVERNIIAAESRRTDDAGEQTGPPLRTGEGAEEAGRLAEIKARLEEIRVEMLEHTGTLVLRAESPGKWRRWADEHPPRENGRDDKGRPVVLAFDEDAAYGLVNASDLLARLGDFFASWNGEELEPEDRTWLIENAPSGDLKQMALIVVQMQEGPGSIPKGLSPSSGTSNGATSPN